MLLILSSRRRMTTSPHSSRPSIGIQLNALRTLALSPTSACTTLLYNTSLPVFTIMCRQERYAPPLTLSCTKYQEQNFLLLDIVPSRTPVQRPGSLPPSLRQTASPDSFKRNLKTFLFTNRFSVNSPTVMCISCSSYGFVHCFCVVFIPRPHPCLEQIPTIGIRRTVNCVVIIIMYV